MTQTQSAISAQELRRLLSSDKPVECIDVRTQPEYDDVHVPGAKLVPLDELDPLSFLKHRNEPDAPLYVICQSGVRAQKAIDRFRKAGFCSCVLVQGGTQAWIDAGLPVNRRPSKVLPLMRQVQITVGSMSALGAALAWMDVRFAAVPLAMGCGLLMAGLTGYCPLALMLAKMPWNRSGGDSGSCCEVKR